MAKQNPQVEIRWGNQGQGFTSSSGSTRERVLPVEIRTGNSSATRERIVPVEFRTGRYNPSAEEQTRQFRQYIRTKDTISQVNDIISRADNTTNALAQRPRGAANRSAQSRASYTRETANQAVADYDSIVAEATEFRNNLNNMGLDAGIRKQLDAALTSVIENIGTNRPIAQAQQMAYINADGTKMSDDEIKAYDATAARYTSGADTYGEHWNSLDYKGKTQYITNLGKDIADARAKGDTEKADELQKEFDWIGEFGGLAADPYFRAEAYKTNAARVVELETELAAANNKVSAAYAELAEARESGYGYEAAEAKYEQAVAEKKEIEREIGDLNAANTLYDRTWAHMDKYNYILAEDDFEEVSSKRDFNNPTPEELMSYDSKKSGEAIDTDTILAGGGYYKDGELYYPDGRPVETAEAPVVEDKLGLYLEAKENGGAGITAAQDQLASQDGANNTWAQLIVEGDANGWAQLDEHEIGIYYYLLNTEGQESAYAYLDGMTTELTRRETEEDLNRVYEAKGFERVVYNLASIPANIFGGAISFLDDAAHVVSGQEINPYSRLHRAQTVAQTTRQTTADIIDNKVAGNPYTRDELTMLWKGEDIGRPIPEGKGNSVLGISLGDVYQAGMSGLDSIFGAVALGGGPAYGIMMGMGAASSTARDYWEMGASKDQIIGASLLAGAAEMVFENDSVANLKALKPGNSLVLNILKQGANEAKEEVLTELANIITNTVVMGSQSDWDEAIAKYENEGKSASEASALALFDVAEQLWNAGVSGFISGAGTGSIYTAARRIGLAQSQNQLYLGLASNPDSKAFKIATEIQAQMADIARRQAAGEEVSSEELESLSAKQDALSEAIASLTPDERKAAQNVVHDYNRSLTAKQRHDKRLGRNVDRLLAENPISEYTDDVAPTSETVTEEASTPEATAEIAETSVSPEPAHTEAVARAVAAANTEQGVTGAQIKSIMQDSASMAELEIAMTGLTNTQKRTAIKKKVVEIAEKERVDKEKTSADNIYTRETADGAASKQPGETAQSKQEAEISFDKFLAGMRADPAFANLSDAQIRSLYESERDARVRNKRRVYLEDVKKWIGYEEFRRVVAERSRKTKQTIPDSVVRAAFDGAYENQTELREVNRAELDGAAERINAMAKKLGLKISARISYDGEGFFTAGNISEKAYVDPDTGEIVFNGAVVSTADMVYRTLAHEIIHPGAEADPELVQLVFDSFQDLNDAGYKFDAKTRRILENLDAEIKTLQGRYQRHENALAKREGRNPRKLSEDFVRVELAGNLLCEVFDKLTLIQGIADHEPSLCEKILAGIKRLRSTISGKNESAKKIDSILQKLNRGLTDALKEAEKKTSEKYAESGNYAITEEAKAAEKQDARDKKNSKSVEYMLVEVSPTTQTPWWQQVDDRLTSDPRSALYIPETSNILAEVGLPDLPLCLTKNHLNDIMHAESPTNPRWHGLDDGTIKRLPELLSKPVMILDSWTTKGDIVVVTTAVDAKNRPVVVAIHPNGTAVIDGVKGPANFITSIYGRENFAPRPGQPSAYNFVYLALRNRSVLYWNKERSEALRQAIGIRFPAGLSKVRSDEIIREYSGYVKGESPQRLFMLSEEDTYGREETEETAASGVVRPSRSVGDDRGRGRARVLSSDVGSRENYPEVGGTGEEENRGRVSASRSSEGPRNPETESRVAGRAVEIGQDVPRTPERNGALEETVRYPDNADGGRSSRILRAEWEDARFAGRRVQGDASENGRGGESSLTRTARGGMQAPGLRSGLVGGVQARSADVGNVSLRDVDGGAAVQTARQITARELNLGPFDFETLPKKLRTWDDVEVFLNSFTGKHLGLNYPLSLCRVFNPDAGGSNIATLAIPLQNGKMQLIDYPMTDAGLRKLVKDFPKLLLKAGFVDDKAWLAGDVREILLTYDSPSKGHLEETYAVLSAAETNSALWESEQTELNRVGYDLFVTRADKLFDFAAGMTYTDERRIVAKEGRGNIQHERLHAYMATDQRLFFRIRDAIIKAGFDTVLREASERAALVWELDAYSAENQMATESEVFCEAFAANTSLLGENILKLNSIVRRIVGQWTRSWDADPRGIDEKTVRYAPREIEAEFADRGLTFELTEEMFDGIEDDYYDAYPLVSEPRYLLENSTGGHLEDSYRSGELSRKELLKFLHKKPVSVDRKWWAKVNSARMERYAGYDDVDIPEVDTFILAEYNKINVAYTFFVRNTGKDSFAVVGRRQVKPNARGIYRMEDRKYGNSNEAPSAKTGADAEGRGDHSVGGQSARDGGELREAAQGVGGKGADFHAGTSREDGADRGSGVIDAPRTIRNISDEIRKLEKRLGQKTTPTAEKTEIRRSLRELRAEMTARMRFALDEEDPTVSSSLDAMIDGALAAYNVAQEAAAKSAPSASDIASVAQTGAPVGTVIYHDADFVDQAAVEKAREVYQQLLDQYGTIQAAESAVRDNSVPRRTKPSNKVSKTVATVLGSAATPDSRVDTIKQMVVTGKVSYVPKTNSKSIVAARGKIRREGFQEVRAEWSRRVRNGEASSDLVTLGATLLNNAGNANASGEEYVGVLVDYAHLLRNAGQALQAAKVLKKLTPEGKLYAVQKTVNEINDRQQKRNRKPGQNVDKKNENDNVPVEDWMEKVGEELAASISARLSTTDEKAKTVSQTILSDLKKFADETLPKQNRKMQKRTSMERLRDLFENKEHYEKAWAAAKKTMRVEFGAKPETMQAINAWLDQSLDFAALLTEEITDVEGVKINEALATAFLSAETDEQRDEILDLIHRDLAAQISATGMERFTALRYLAMLGNLRTQVRNILGNAAFQPVRMTSATFQGVMEALLERAGVRLERTTSALHDMATFKEAFKEYESVRDAILSGGKYQEGDRTSEEIEKYRTIFRLNVNIRGKDVNLHPLEYARRATNWAMDTGDSMFCSFTFADALSRYMKANRTTWSKASDGLKDRARAYAIREAAEATYRDNNAFAQMISRVARAKNDSLPERIKAGIFTGVLPFRKTPANILVRAMEYSPVGLLDTAFKAARVARGSDVVSGTDIVRSLSKSLTGTALTVLGFALASMGKLLGKAPEDDDERAFWEMMGYQEYAIVIGDNTYTLDWLAPECIPLFLGANLHQAGLGMGMTLAEGLKAVGSLTDPLLSMSMLQGVNDALESAASYGDDSALTRFTGKSMWALLTQVVPTILGQAERASTNTRMTTYVDKNNENIPSGIQRLLGKLSAKIPGWDYAQIVYTDAWGRTQQNAQSETWNVINQFVSPGYSSTIEQSDMEAELLRVYEATGDSSVLISPAPSYFTVNGQRVDLTGSQYVEFNTTRGQTAYAIMTELVASDAYALMTDQEKAKAIARVYDFATQSAKYDLTDGAYAADKWVVNAKTAAYDVGLPVETVVLYRTEISTLNESYPDGVPVDGDTVEVNEYVRRQIFADGSLTTEQKHALDEIVLTDGRYIVEDISVDYSSPDSFVITQTSESSQKKYEYLPSRFDLDAEEFSAAYDIYNNDELTATEKRAELAGITGSESTGAELYDYFGADLLDEDDVKDLPRAVGTELVRLSTGDVGFEYSIAPPSNMPTSYTDPNSKEGGKATREWVLTSAQQDHYVEMRDSEYESAMTELINSSEYRNASDAEKCEMIEELKSEVSESVKESFVEWLSANYASTPRK